MNISIISFTKQGCTLSQNLSKQLPEHEIHLYTKCQKAGKEQRIPFVEESISQWACRQMEEKNALLFIGACGIAVRAIAPHITHKLHDSPVLVTDEYGTYVIPLLSGHIGGANSLACAIAENIGAVPVITTATDLHHVFAADIFAQKNNLFIENPQGIVTVSSKILSGEPITLSVESGHLSHKSHPPAQVKIAEYPPQRTVDILVSSGEEHGDASLRLKPRPYTIGIGCRKGKDAKTIEAFIRQSLNEAGLSTEQVNALATITLKSKEQGLIAWSRKQRIPYITYTPEELEEITEAVHGSEFVKKITGVDNVCERAALKAAGPGGELVYEKHAKDGMTIAVAKGSWSVNFYET